MQFYPSLASLDQHMSVSLGLLVASSSRWNEVGIATPSTLVASKILIYFSRSQSSSVSVVKNGFPEPAYYRPFLGDGWHDAGYKVLLRLAWRSLFCTASALPFAPRHLGALIHHSCNHAKYVISGFYSIIPSADADTAKGVPPPYNDSDPLFFVYDLQPLHRNFERFLDQCQVTHRNFTAPV